VDICDAAIDAARERAISSKIEVDYLRTDVYDLNDGLFGKFDLVYMTIGGLVWLPDINKLFAIINKLLKAQGTFFIYDSHPLCNCLPWTDESEGRPELIHPYFSKHAWEWADSMDYYGGAEYDAPVHYEFTYTLSEILMAMINNGINLTFMSEYEHDISNGFEWLQKMNLKLPLAYILSGQKHKEISYEDRPDVSGRSENCRICS
jgi:SAM-dependent methyltransferase